MAFTSYKSTENIKILDISNVRKEANRNEKQERESNT